MTQPSTPISGPPTNLPLALLPVRIETRFVTEDGSAKLLVRVYVDDLSVDAHEPGLSDLEITWGEHFWEQAWRAGLHQPGERAAWDQLASMFGGPRAAYVAEILLPTNATQRPTSPTPSDQPLPVAPTFPTPSRPVSPPWRAPRTTAIPDRWIAIGYVGGQRAFTFVGNPITTDPLIVGLSPGRGVDPTTLGADPDAGWLVDFTAAEAKGMGLRIPYTLPTTTRLDRLLVLGTRAGASGADGAARIGSLLRAQRYTAGLSFVQQGTPSNNTPDVTSGFSSLDTGFEGSPLARADWPTLQTGDGSNRDVTARALGIDNAVLAGLRGAGDGEQRDAYHINTTIWKATWGYYLEQLIAGPGAPTDDQIRQAREHFSSYVRARGPLPALRIGRQPYGVLPAIALDLWQPREGTSVDAAIVRLIRALRDIWRRSLAAVPRLPGSDDPAASLLSILAMSPTSVGYFAHAAQPVVHWPASTTPLPSVGRLGELARLQQQLGLTLVPRHARTLFTSYQQALHLGGGLVQPLVSVADLPPQEILSDTERVDRDYVSWIGTATLSQLRTETLAPPPTTLLYLLLRHSALLEYAAAGFRIRLRQGAVTADARREPDVVGTQSPTPWDLLTQTATQDPPVLATYLDNLKAVLVSEANRDLAPSGAIWRRGLYDVGGASGDRATDLRDFAAVMRSLAYLGTRPSAVLSRLLAEALDLTSHRLDAWATSFATKRLETLRAQTGAAGGLYLGGYGCVEDLMPTPRTTATPPTPPPGESAAPELASSLYLSPNNKGFVHAPSLSHATTAAILRSGYLTRQATGDGQSLALNLSSARVRTAMWLLGGVRQGQPLSALLGYRFERGLHENHPGLVLDQYIGTFRRLVSNGTGPGSTTDVVDGLALLTRYRASTVPWGSGSPPLPTTGADHDACLAELRALDDAVDAIADLVTAEAVHHVALGDPMRAGATLEAIAHGEVPPPDIEITRTPRSGVGVTHRVIVASQDGSVPVGWGTPTARAAAEPFLNAWAARLLGPGAPSATCQVEYLDTTTGEPILLSGLPAKRQISLGDPGLRLSPLDLVYLPERAQAAQWSELEQRVAYVALRSPPTGVPPTLGVRLTFTRTSGAPLQPPAFAEILESAHAARQLMTTARPLTAADLALADAQVPDTLAADVPPPNEPSTAPERLLRLADRASTASKAFIAATDALDAVLRPTDPALVDLDRLRGALLDVSAYGIAGAVPLFPTGADDVVRARLLAQASSVAHEAAERTERLRNVEAHAPPAGASAAAIRDFHVERLRTIFGSDFCVLPRFSAPDAANVSRTLASSDALQNGNPLASVEWFQRITRVRTRAALLDTSLMYAEALGGGDSLTFRVGQLPVTDRDVWTALPLVPQPADAPPARPPGGRLSLVIHPTGALDVTRPLAGLLVDEWTEVVPSAEETTGFVFHYDHPSAQAPQAILLAVPPDLRPTWDVDALEATILETLELARLRIVDLNALGEITQYLPAAVLTAAPNATSIAADFSRLPPA